MTHDYLVRTGNLGSVGCFEATEQERYDRGTLVVCRTDRGLEVGEVLHGPAEHPAERDGQIVRRVTAEDQVRLARFERWRSRAYSACQSIIQQLDIPVVLMDVEALFDGESMYFDLVGSADVSLEPVSQQLRQVFGTDIRFRFFEHEEAHGCGTGCCSTSSTEGGCADKECSACPAVDVCKNAVGYDKLATTTVQQNVDDGELATPYQNPAGTGHVVPAASWCAGARHNDGPTKRG